mmetsp:Transcript_11783/g.23360  ORF Transcript_11783/g.23360 Transcript_11783/m.23360 type:complete len:100 (+) Transcript_11783:1-300(+)
MDSCDPSNQQHSRKANCDRSRNTMPTPNHDYQGSANNTCQKRPVFFYGAQSSLNCPVPQPSFRGTQGTERRGRNAGHSTRSIKDLQLNGIVGQQAMRPT